MQVRGDAPLTTPCIDQLLTQFRQRGATSEVITDPVTQPEPPRTQPVRSTVTDKGDPVNEERIRKLEHQMSQLIQQVYTFLKINFLRICALLFFFLLLFGFFKIMIVGKGGKEKVVLNVNVIDVLLIYCTLKLFVQYKLFMAIF